MKKLVSLLCAILMVFSMVGCQSTNDEAVIAERLPVDFDLVLEETFNDSAVFYYSFTRYEFKEEYLLEHEVSYNEDEDAFYVKLVFSDDALDNRQMQGNYFLTGGKNPKITTFVMYYKTNLYDQMSDLDIYEDVYIEVYSESGERLSKSSLV